MTVFIFMQIRNLLRSVYNRQLFKYCKNSIDQPSISMMFRYIDQQIIIHLSLLANKFLTRMYWNRTTKLRKIGKDTTDRTYILSTNKEYFSCIFQEYKVIIVNIITLLRKIPFVANLLRYPYNLIKRMK